MEISEYDERMNHLNEVQEKLRELRRYYNNLLMDTVEGKREETNVEDLVRLVGTLEAAYNHVLASIAGDGDIYCILKHLSYALILCGEMDTPNTGEIYYMLTVLSKGIIEPCASCKREEK